MILSESGRPVSAASLGLPGTVPIATSAAPFLVDPVAVNAAVEPTWTVDSPAAASGSENAAGEAVVPPAVPVTDASGGVLRLDALEKEAIRAALRQSGANRTQAAALLGISIRTLRNKLQEYREAGDPVDVAADVED